MVGSVCRLVSERAPVAALLVALCWHWSVDGVAHAQELYKYRGENGEWIYSDRPPADQRTVKGMRWRSNSMAMPRFRTCMSMAG